MKFQTLLKGAAVSGLLVMGSWYGDKMVKEDAQAQRETARIVSELERGVRQVRIAELPGEYANGFSPEPGLYGEFVAYADSASQGLRSPREILCWQSFEGGREVAMTQSFRGRSRWCPFPPGDVFTTLHGWDQDASYKVAADIGLAKR